MYGVFVFQTQFLIQEFGNLLGKPNFVSTLCYAIDNPLHHQKVRFCFKPRLLNVLLVIMFFLFMYFILLAFFWFCFVIFGGKIHSWIFLTYRFIVNKYIPSYFWQFQTFHGMCFVVIKKMLCSLKHASSNQLC